MKLLTLQDFVQLGGLPNALVDQVLPEKSLMLISGEPYVGKSLIAMDLALGVAWGSTVLGKFRARRANVIYVGMDSPNWYSAWMAACLVRGREAAGERVPDDDHLWFVTRATRIRPLDSDTGTEEFIEAATEMRVEVIIMDTLRKAHTRNENDSGLMSAVLDRCRLMNDAGIAVILLHHKAKPKEGGEASKAYDTRGSTVIPADVDIHWAIEKRDGASRVFPVKGRGVEDSADLAPFDLILTKKGPPQAWETTVQWQEAQPDPPAMPKKRRGRPRLVREEVRA